MGPYVGFVRNGVCVVAECLASHPTWLYDHRAVLGSRSLRSLVLPGTHNAGSYTLADDNDVVAAWVVCQDEDIISQLLYGNRYLDLRVAYYPETHELLWINHDLVRWRPLQEVLENVRGFLALSPDPVIIDIHRTPVGFNLPESMELLLSLMNATLGGHFVHSRHGPHVTLDDLWQMGKRVIFTFNDPAVSDYTPWVWPPLPQAWANAQLLDDLRSFLDSQMNKRFESPRLWAAMAHLTPTLWDLLFRSHVGVRGLADRVSFSITRWLRERWGHMANIVASDFFRSNDIINVAIRTNLALSMCRPTDPSRHPYTLRWTTELTLRHGSPSTTIPPFVRRMYSGGALWSTTGVRQIHYPFIPVENNISTVYTAIPTRRSSVAPGVTYQSNGNTWREVFHYPTDGSPQPPEAVSPISAARPPSPATPSLTTTTESSPKVSVEDILSEWDTEDSHDPLDEELPDGMENSESGNTNSSARMSGLLEGHLADRDSALLSAGPGGEDTAGHSRLPGSGNKSPSASSPLSRDLGDREPSVDAFVHTDSSLSTRNTLEYEGSVPTISSNNENEYLVLTSNAQQDNNTVLLGNDYRQDEYVLSATITALLNVPTSPTLNATQELFSLSSREDKAEDNSSSTLTSNNTDNDSIVLPIDDIKTSPSRPVHEHLPVEHPKQRFPLDQVEYDNRPSEPSDDSKDEGVWAPENALPATESTHEGPLRGVVTLKHQQASDHSVELPQPPKQSTAQTYTQTITPQSVPPEETAKYIPVTLPALLAVHTGRARPTTPVMPETTSTRVPPVAPSIVARPAAPTVSTQTLVSDVTAGKSSSQVT